MLTRFNWADNKLKLERAINKVGSEASEFQVQQEYIKFGGRVIGELIKEGRIPQIATLTTPPARRGRPKNVNTTPSASPVASKE